MVRRADLPLEFFLSLGGLVLCGGLLLWLLYAILTRPGVLGRVRALFVEERASAAVEFPFAILVLIQVALLTFQLTFLVTGFLVVDYAAYAAARAAIVVIPQDTVEEPADDEDATGPKGLAANDLGGSSGAPADGPGFGPTDPGKIRDIFLCAAWNCVPISGLRFDINEAYPEEALNEAIDDAFATHESSLGAVSDLFGLGGRGFQPDLGFVTDFLAGVDEVSLSLQDEISSKPGGPFLLRLGYAMLNTQVHVSGGPTYSRGDELTVRVTHWFQLGVPYARTLLESSKAFGDAGIPWRIKIQDHQRPIRAEVTLINEGGVGVAAPVLIHSRYD